MLLSLTSCVVVGPADVYTDECVVFHDDLGEREVCGVRYYRTPKGDLYYYDERFSIWVGPRGFYRGGIYYFGIHPGYREYYGPNWYYPHGYFRYRIR